MLAEASRAYRLEEETTSLATREISYLKGFACSSACQHLLETGGGSNKTTVCLALIISAFAGSVSSSRGEHPENAAEKQKDGASSEPSEMSSESALQIPCHTLHSSIKAVQCVCPSRAEQRHLPMKLDSECSVAQSSTKKHIG
uniref:Uncharacterized protein n=1 Tax=Sphaerodactylus townsendi TaxID=933632 RepID=A0ACB8FWL5_9SAUR